MLLEQLKRAVQAGFLESGVFRTNFSVNRQTFLDFLTELDLDRRFFSVYPAAGEIDQPPGLIVEVTLYGVPVRVNSLGEGKGF